MPLMPLALDIYVKSLRLKGIKHRVSTSTKSNEAEPLSEAKLASRCSPDSDPPMVRIQSRTSPMNTILRQLVSVFLILTISLGTASSASDSLRSVEKSIRGVDAYAWAPTGDSLIYATSDGTLWSAQGPDFAKAVRIIKIALPDEQKIEQVVWSPDGQNIAVVSPRVNDRLGNLWDTIWLLNLRTSQLRDLLPPGAPFGSPGRRTLQISTWWPDGRIAFVEHCGTGCVGLHAVQSETGEQYWDFCDASGSFFWSPTKKSAVFENDYSGVAAAGLGLVSASDGVAVRRGASYYRPRRECGSVFQGVLRGGVHFNGWFPDDTTVLFTDVKPDGSELKLWDTVSGLRTTLVTHGSSGALSPDGRYVAFLRRVHESATTLDSNRLSLAILDLRSKKIVAFKEIPIVQGPIQWSPTESYLTILVSDGHLLLAKITPAGIKLQQIELDEPDVYHELSWSPDGKYLADWSEASGLKIFGFN
jgi:WD40 repeat protein